MTDDLQPGRPSPNMPGVSGDQTPVRTNTNGIVGTCFSAFSVLGWLTLCFLMVPYDAPNPAPEPTGDHQRDGAQDLGHDIEELVWETGAFAANAFFVVTGGFLSAVFLLIGIVVSALGLGHPRNTLPITGIVLGLVALMLGILFVCWRWNLWFG